MRTGNYMTADRMIALATAGFNIAQFYERVEREIAVFRANSFDDTVSLDTLQEILNRCRPALRDLSLVHNEMRYFETHRVRHEKNRDHQRFRREADLESRLFHDPHDPNPLDIAPRPTPTRPKSYNDPRSIETLYSELVEMLGRDRFASRDEILTALATQDDKILAALIAGEFLKESASPDRFYIPTR